MIRFIFLLMFAMPVAAAERDYPPLPKPVTSFGAATADSFVYVYGGHTGRAHTYSTETTLGQLLRLSIANPAKWEELPGGPSLMGLAMVSHDGKIYRIGGMQPMNKPGEKADTRSLRTVARYDPKAKKWADLPDLPEGRSSHDAAVVGDKIYVMGGWTMNGPDKESVWHKTALVLDLKQQPLKWEMFDQPFVRRALTVAAHDGKLYAIAGMNQEGNAERTVNVYDPAGKSWSKSADIPEGFLNGFNPAACECDGQLYLSPANGKVYRLAEKRMAWDEAAVLKLSRVVHRIVPAGNAQLVVLGGSAKGSPTADVEAIPLPGK